MAESLAARLSEAGTIYLTDFTGLNVDAMSRLRERLRAEGAEYVVAKNTLTRRALDGLDLPDLSEHLKGPTGLVIGVGDPIVPAKVIKEFAREHDNRPVVKVGVVDRREVSAEAVSRLADLPPRDQLLGLIAGNLAAPVAGIAGVLESLVRDVAYMIHQVATSNASS